MSSVSPKYWRRSEWPMMTWVQPISSSMAGQISPVYAPSFSQYRSCAPMATFEPLAASIANIEIDVGRADNDFVAGVAGHQGQEIVEECLGLLGVLVHLPVGGHQLLSAWIPLWKLWHEALESVKRRYTWVVRGLRPRKMTSGWLTSCPLAPLRREVFCLPEIPARLRRRWRCA